MVVGEVIAVQHDAILSAMRSGLHRHLLIGSPNLL